MLQGLLGDRFKLVARREFKGVPVYALTVARGGPKLHASDLPSNAVEVPRTPFLAMGSEPTTGYLVFQNESMSDFAWALSRMVGLDERIVIDRTRLTGRFDFELKFQRHRLSTTEAGGPILADEPTIFDALQQQLGLKLESTRAEGEFLVIEHVQQVATEN